MKTALQRTSARRDIFSGGGDNPFPFCDNRRLVGADGPNLSARNVYKTYTSLPTPSESPAMSLNSFSRFCNFFTNWTFGSASSTARSLYVLFGAEHSSVATFRRRAPFRPTNLNRAILDKHDFGLRRKVARRKKTQVVDWAGRRCKTVGEGPYMTITT